VPIAFLLTLGVIISANQLLEWAAHSRPARVVLKAGLYAFIFGTLLCNGLLYAVEVRIARSDRFYQRYETGLDLTLISAIKCVLAQPDVNTGRIAISPRYTNFGKSKASPFPFRAAVLLADREIVTPPYPDTQYPPTYATRPTRNLRRWLRNANALYYIYQPEISPWRVWHFRVGWYQKMLTHVAPGKDHSAWQVYRIDPRGAVRQLAYPITHEYPTRVPGL
jgi:hypothetical protein